MILVALTDVDREAVLELIYECTARGGIDPSFREESGKQYLHPSSVPYGLSLRIPYRRKRDPYSKRHLFRNSSSIIITQPEGDHKGPWILQPHPNYPASTTLLILAKRQLITPEDFVAIRDSYSIPSSITLLPPDPYETSRDDVMTWFYEREGYRSDRYVWRELLVCKLLKGFSAFFGRGNMKTIDNPPSLTPGWKSRYFFA
ncbi:hypothetical protein ACLOJK_036643 [Asimina triloba]